MYTFVDWVRAHIKNHTMTMIDFVNWLSLKEREGFIFLSFTPTLGVFCILRVYCATCPLRHFNIFSHLPIKKENVRMQICKLLPFSSFECRKNHHTCHSS